MDTKRSPKIMKRIPHIEGLRAYLAFWVVFDHILGVSGYSVQMLSGLPKIVRQGWYAVDLFIIISGFVIFYLLDHKNERYIKFITRRFFRLWPLFIFLFFIGIPTSLLALSNLHAFSDIYPTAYVGDGAAAERISLWWEHIFMHIGLHIPMLHGVVPDVVLPNAPSAFLGPAWSISLEWQFYLIAPFVFGFALSRFRMKTVILCFATVIIFLIGRKLPHVPHGAFLPMHIEYFFLGCLSYFGFKWMDARATTICLTPIAATVSIFLFFICGMNSNVLPISLWLLFFGLIIDLQREKREFYIKATGWLFNNRVALYLGKISYSIYLSHALIIVVGQFLLIRFAPQISQKEHVLFLGLIVTILTIGVSHVLFVMVESPGMRIGKKIANSLKDKKANKAVQTTANAVSDL